MAGNKVSKGEGTSYSALAYLSLFGLAIALPLLILLSVLLFQSASAQREELQNRILQIRDALANDLDRDLDRDITILHTLATSQALAGGNWAAFYDQAKAGLQGRAYLVLVDSEGRQIANTYVPFGKQPRMTGDPETIRRIARTKSPLVSNMFVSLVVRKSVFNVSVPILHNGQLRYVMSLGLFPDDLVALLRSQNLGPEWVQMIWDRRGRILVRSRQNVRFLGTPLPPRLVAPRQDAVLRATNLDGKDVLYATTVSRLSGWGVGVNVPYALITAPMRRSLLLSAAATVVAIAIALLLGLYFARQIGASLSLASRAARAFGRGEAFPITGSRLNEADAFLATLKRAQDELSRTQAQQRFLTRELEHRTQNLFAIIQAIVARSLTEDQSVPQAKRVIMGRLNALARTHAILAGTAWEGAPLREILERELGEVFAGSSEITGCDIIVSAAAAHQLALIFHELATNAIKYGALSAANGRVRIAGNVSHASGAPQFSLLWKETGGPPVSQPTRKGFGSVLLLEVAKQFGMEIAITYDLEGLNCSLRGPLQNIVPPEQSAVIKAAAPPGNEPVLSKLTKAGAPGVGAQPAVDGIID